jgi:hypothetical protein
MPSMKKYLPIGGLVAAGFDSTGEYLLTITHSGRGVFSTTTWERVARDHSLAYPENGKGIGIGPIGSVEIAVVELDSDHDCHFQSRDGTLQLHCESSGIDVEQLDK